METTSVASWVGVTASLTAVRWVATMAASLVARLGLEPDRVRVVQATNQDVALQPVLVRHRRGHVADGSRERDL